jgi:hypothetical protein
MRIAVSLLLVSLCALPLCSQQPAYHVVPGSVVLLVLDR